MPVLKEHIAVNTKESRAVEWTEQCQSHVPALPQTVGPWAGHFTSVHLSLSLGVDACRARQGDLELWSLPALIQIKQNSGGIEKD